MIENNFSKRIALKNVRVCDDFWSDYIELVRKEVIPYQLSALNDKIENAPKSHSLDNFRKAAAVVDMIKRGEKPPVYPVDKWEYTEENSDKNSFLGWCFQDSDVYKWLEAVGYSLINRPDSELQEKADEIIALICSAQLENGYLDTLYIINDRDKIFTNLKDRHELYCFGHLAEAAISYYNATKNRKLLDTAISFADYICGIFGENGKRGYPGHEIAELALMKLYRLTKNKNYLEAAHFFISERGKKPYYFDTERGYNRTDGSDDYFYNQAHKEPVNQDEAVGHAVRGVYLYTGMAMLAKSEKSNPMLSACEKIWSNIEKKKLYITGGIGATVDGEAFSFDYDLPNDTAYCETCASIGLAFFAREMAEINPNGKYADVAERAIYNTILSGMSEDGKSFFYVNPLEVLPEASKKDSRKRHVKPVRQKWFGCACCPPNLARFISSIGEYICSENDDTLYIHHYVGADIEADCAKVNIKSDYLESGRVKISVKPEKSLNIALRIPGWCKGFKINIPYEISGGYAYIKTNNDIEIDINFEITPRFVRSSNRVRENIGKTAVMRGPVVYCAEEKDNGKDLQLLSFDISKAPIYNADGSISACGFREKKDSADSLYFDCAPTDKTPCVIRLVPYRTWGNRGENEMAVYLAG